MLSMQVCYVRLDEIKNLYKIRMMLCGNTSSNIFGKSYFIHKAQGFGVKNVYNFVRNRGDVIWQILDFECVHLGTETSDNSKQLSNILSVSIF